MTETETEDRDKLNQVSHPPHYMKFPVEVIEIIRQTLITAYGKDAFKAFCLGCELKYRLRAGFKATDGDGEIDIAKAMTYRKFRVSGEWRGES